MFCCREVLLVLFCQSLSFTLIITLSFTIIINFSRVPEGTLGSLSVRFCSLFVLPCLAISKGERAREED